MDYYKRYFKFLSLMQIIPRKFFLFTQRIIIAHKLKNCLHIYNSFSLKPSPKLILKFDSLRHFEDGRISVQVARRLCFLCAYFIKKNLRKLSKLFSDLRLKSVLTIWRNIVLFCVILDKSM